MARDVAPVGIVRVLRAIVQELLLGDLIDKEVQEDADDDSLVEGVADQVIHLVVDTMQLLKPLKVTCCGGRVCDCPKTQVVHVAQHGPAMLERNWYTILLQIVVSVQVFRLADVVHVRD